MPGLVERKLWRGNCLPIYAVKLEEELDKRGIGVVGCIHYDLEVFKSSMEGSGLGIGKERAAEEIRDVLHFYKKQRQGG